MPEARKPRVSFNSKNIYKRIDSCRSVAAAFGWDNADIASFVSTAQQAFSYEEAMFIIYERFEVVS